MDLFKKSGEPLLPSSWYFHNNLWKLSFLFMPIEKQKVLYWCINFVITSMYVFLWFAFAFFDFFARRSFGKCHIDNHVIHPSFLSKVKLAFVWNMCSIDRSVDFSLHMFCVADFRVWFRWVAAQSVFYHLYNQVSYMSLDQISPLTFSIGNTMKRISVIVSSIIIFHTPVQPVNALGAAIAILGTFLYSQVIFFCFLPLYEKSFNVDYW